MTQLSLRYAGTLAVAAILSPPSLSAFDPLLDQKFTQTVRPVITKYCIGCHSGNAAAAQFDLKAYDSMAPVLRDYPRWELMLARLSANEMPPKQAPQPSSENRRRVIEWDSGGPRRGNQEERGRSGSGVEPAAQQRRV